MVYSLNGMIPSTNILFPTMPSCWSVASCGISQMAIFGCDSRINCPRSVRCAIPSRFHFCVQISKQYPHLNTYFWIYLWWFDISPRNLLFGSIWCFLVPWYSHCQPPMVKVSPPALAVWPSPRLNVPRLKLNRSRMNFTGWRIGNEMSGDWTVYHGSIDGLLGKPNGKLFRMVYHV